MRIVCLKYELLTLDPLTGRGEVACDFLLSEYGFVLTVRLFDIPHEVEPKDIGLWLAGNRRIGVKFPSGVSLGELAEKSFLAAAFASFLAIASQAPQMPLPSGWVN
jgi:hypothetical protein